MTKKFKTLIKLSGLVLEKTRKFFQRLQNDARISGHYYEHVMMIIDTLIDDVDSDWGGDIQDKKEQQGLF